MTYAYTQVRICERITKARHEFIKRQGFYGVPDRLYLGRDDLLDLHREAEYWQLHPMDDPAGFLTFMEMEIFEVSRDRHLFVARAEK